MAEVWCKLLQYILLQRSRFPVEVLAARSAIGQCFYECAHIRLVSRAQSTDAWVTPIVSYYSTDQQVTVTKYSSAKRQGRRRLLANNAREISGAFFSEEGKDIQHIFGALRIHTILVSTVECPEFISSCCQCLFKLFQMSRQDIGMFNILGRHYHVSQSRCVGAVQAVECCTFISVCVGSPSVLYCCQIESMKSSFIKK